MSTKINVLNLIINGLPSILEREKKERKRTKKF